MCDRLTDAELREACEAVGLDGHPIQSTDGIWWNVGGTAIPRDWAESIAASLLMARVREAVRDNTPVRKRNLAGVLVGHWWEHTNAQRIRAAMEVLR